jgi:hypothetical protein
MRAAISRRVWSLAWRRCSAMARRIVSSSSLQLSAHNSFMDFAQASMSIFAFSIFSTSNLGPASYRGGRTPT